MQASTLGPSRQTRHWDDARWVEAANRSPAAIDELGVPLYCHHPEHGYYFACYLPDRGWYWSTVRPLCAPCRWLVPVRVSGRY